jgi:hypothetical protein
MKETKDLFGSLKSAEELAKDLLGAKDIFKGMTFPHGKTAFGKLISAQHEQILVIRDAYEEELKDLSIKVDALEDRIGVLEAEKEMLEEKLLKKATPKAQKEAKDESKQSSAQ